MLLQKIHTEMTQPSQKYQLQAFSWISECLTHDIHQPLHRDAQQRKKAIENERGVISYSSSSKCGCREVFEHTVCLVSELELVKSLPSLVLTQVALMVYIVFFCDILVPFMGLETAYLQ